ncbi:type VI secretion system tube protein TssD [Tenacibaculum maritimum]|uniref:Glycine zipper family protein n=3 Tax=Tenacibaculum maritimum TaxID=107401 RepID=A0A2H1EAS0_9FLAO|nr:type VI secretion system tube protein TssD [Tenacibaculum maritimum]SFZ83439.1 conserved protein of unknown function [Tenacibaculum maritimum NCIMB 2154]
MSFVAKLIIENKEIDLLSYRFGFSKKVNEQSRPIQLTSFKGLEMEIEATESIYFEEWMTSERAIEKIELQIFYPYLNGGSKIMTFYDCYLIGFQTTFSNSNEEPMINRLKITSAGVKTPNSELEYTTDWRKTFSITEQYQTPVYETPVNEIQGEETEKQLKEEIIDSWWSSDFEGENKINKASIGETTYFHIKTKNIPDNTELNFNLIDQGVNIIGNKEKITVNYKTNVKNNKVVINLDLDPAWDEVFANEPDVDNLSVKLSWETTLNDIKNPLLTKENDFLEIVKEGHGFTFIIFEEILPSGKITRKVGVPPIKNTSMFFDRIIHGTPSEYFGMEAKAPNSAATIAEHVANNKPSKFLSASTLKSGAPTIEGTLHYIDKNKFEKSGGKIYSTSEIITHLEKYKEGLFTESAKARIDKLINVVKNTEQEVLLEGHVAPDMIKSKGTIRLVKGLRVVAVVGIVLSAYELGKATNESIEEDSSKPIVAEMIRQAGGWGGAIVGAKIGASAGATLSLVSGPGAILCGAIGGLVFGTAGYFGADWIADHINEN